VSHLPSTKWSATLVATLIVAVALEIAFTLAIVSAIFNWHLFTLFAL